MCSMSSIRDSNALSYGSCYPCLKVHLDKTCTLPQLFYRTKHADTYFSSEATLELLMSVCLYVRMSCLFLLLATTKNKSKDKNIHRSKPQQVRYPPTRTLTIQYSTILIFLMKIPKYRMLDKDILTFKYLIVEMFRF